MADFISNYWSWFIIVSVVLGFIFMFWLIIWQSKDDRQQGKTETMGHIWDEDLAELNNPLPKWWLNLFYITLIFGVVYLALYPGLGSFKGFLGWTQLGQYDSELKRAEQAYGPIYAAYLKQDIKELAKDTNAMKTGTRLFVNNCTICHGSDARGSTGFPNLTDNDWLYGGSPEAIKTTIMNGRNGNMPGWKAALGGTDILNVSEYILSLSGKQANPNVVAAGKVKFVQLCTSCHGKDARGNALFGAPNLTDSIWLHGGSQEAVMLTISEGRTGRMPAHKNFLGEGKSHLLAAYVYSLSQGE